MALHPTMRRRIHERLHPLIGDEETDALLDAIPDDPPTKEWFEERFYTKELIDDRFATKEWMEERFYTKDRIDDRFSHLEQRIDDRFAQLDDRFATKEWLESRFDRIDDKFDRVDEKFDRINERLRQQIHLVYGAAAFCAVLISIIDRIWG